MTAATGHRSLSSGASGLGRALLASSCRVMLTWRSRLRSRDDLVQPRIGIGRLVESGHDRLDEFARQPDHALVLRLDPGPGLDDEPRNVDAEAERKDQRQQEIDPPAQGKVLPHRLCPRPRRIRSRI